MIIFDLLKMQRKSNVDMDEKSTRKYHRLTAVTLIIHFKTKTNFFFKFHKTGLTTDNSQNASNKP